MENINWDQLKTKEDIESELKQRNIDAVTNTRAELYKQITDPLSNEAWLKLNKDLPEVAPIWAEREKIQKENPYPDEIIETIETPIIQG